jgi:hypothetical protein
MYELGIPPVFKNINDVNRVMLRTMKTVFILVLIAAVYMCSEEDVSGVETKEDELNPIVPQKPSDNQGNVNDSQNKRKGMENIFYCDSEIPMEEKEARLRKMVERFKKETEKPEVKLLHQKLKEEQPFKPEEKDHGKSILLGILELKKDASLGLVWRRTIEVIFFVTGGSFDSPYAEDTELLESIEFIRKVRFELPKW